MRALWAPGTKAYSDGGVSLPETTCYPRPLAPIPVIVGGNGERRTLRIAAELGRRVQPGHVGPRVLRHKISVLRAHCADVGRDPAEVAVTVLDLPVVGRDRDDVWARVERLRGRTAAAAFAARRHAGTVAEHRDRHAALAELGVSTVFLSTPDLDGPRRRARPGGPERLSGNCPTPRHAAPSRLDLLTPGCRDAGEARRDVRDARPRAARAPTAAGDR